MTTAARPFESLIQHMSLLGALHEGFRQAQADLEAHIGLPVCMPDCGKCCEHNTCLVWGIEVEYIVSGLITRTDLVDNVRGRCREWLAKSNGPSHRVSPGKLAQDPTRLMEMARAVYNGKCPLLDSDKKCLIHDLRPIACRAYGVTHYPGSCSRPIGHGESYSRRAINTGFGEVLSKRLTDLLVSAAQADRSYAMVGFLPTLILSRLDAPMFTGLVDSGRVDTAKLSRNFLTSPALLFESQIVTLTLAGAEALSEVEAKGVNPDPFNIVAGGAR